jgi:hypothetical protein
VVEAARRIERGGNAGASSSSFTRAATSGEPGAEYLIWYVCGGNPE